MHCWALICRCECQHRQACGSWTHACKHASGSPYCSMWIAMLCMSCLLMELTCMRSTCAISLSCEPDGSTGCFVPAKRNGKICLHEMSQHVGGAGGTTDAFLPAAYARLLKLQLLPTRLAAAVRTAGANFSPRWHPAAASMLLLLFGVFLCGSLGGPMSWKS